MQTRVAVVPDLNQNEVIEGISQTAGAYIGAATAAVVGGVLTGLTSLFRGAVAGAQNTYANLGNQEIPVHNTAAGKKLAAGASLINDLTEDDLQELLRIKQRRAELAASTNGH